MTRRTALFVSLALLGIALAVAVGFGVITRRTPPVSPTQNVPTTWQTARKSTMHETHVDGGKVACATCHTQGFETKPTEAPCAGCHAKAVAHAHHGDPRSPTTCMTCHAFAKGQADATCVSCHGAGGAASRPAEGGTDAARAAHALARHVSKDVACTACHDVHGDPAAKARVTLADCTACHTTTTIAHGRVHEPAAAAHEGATRAHDAHDAGESSDAAVARFAADVRAAAALRDAGGGVVAQVCTACHAPHSAAVAAGDACASCHVGGAGARSTASDSAARNGELLLAGFAPRIEPRGAHVAGHAACITCHEPHRAEKADTRRCEDCHADHRSAITPAAHTACTGCHTPHAPTEARASCASAGCHAGTAVLAAPKVAAHAACASCHDPHRPTASPALACVKCHGEVQPKHPGSVSKISGASTCIGCHAPHGGAGAKAAGAKLAGAVAIATTCSSCHTKAHGDRSLHAGGVACTTCHKPHEFAASLLHDAAGRPAHGIPAPAAKAEEAALCASCHAAKTAAVAARPGHAECGACHGAAHTPVKKPACATCHAQETASAPRGHSACTQCHDAHSGSLGTHAACASCHADKPKEQHGALPGGCASCHTPHGPKGVTTPPACTTCHARPTLDGLHSVAAHSASCASCHSSHAPVRSDRATCTSTCHQDRKNHQPEAKVCKGCHMFRK